EGTAAVESREGYRYAKMASLPAGREDYLQGLVVAVDPFTGDVKAMVGGRDYSRSPFNRAAYALRQPGSSIKPFVYARAITDSITANTIVPDTALHIAMPNGTVYSPDNSDNQFMG